MPRGRSLAGLGGRLPGGSPGNLSARVREAGLPSFQAHGIRVTSLTSGNHLGRKIFFLAEQKSSRFLWTKKKKDVKVLFCWLLRRPPEAPLAVSLLVFVTR